MRVAAEENLIIFACDLPVVPPHSLDTPACVDNVGNDNVIAYETNVDACLHRHFLVSQLIKSKQQQGFGYDSDGKTFVKYAVPSRVFHFRAPYSIVFGFLQQCVKCDIALE